MDQNQCCVYQTLYFAFIPMRSIVYILQNIIKLFHGTPNHFLLNTCTCKQTGYVVVLPFCVSKLTTDAVDNVTRKCELIDLDETKPANVDTDKAAVLCF